MADPFAAARLPTHVVVKGIYNILAPSHISFVREETKPQEARFFFYSISFSIFIKMLTSQGLAILLSKLSLEKKCFILLLHQTITTRFGNRNFDYGLSTSTGSSCFGAILVKELRK